jgi:hypothetical protein
MTHYINKKSPILGIPIIQNDTYRNIVCLIAMIIPIMYVIQTISLYQLLFLITFPCLLLFSKIIKKEDLDIVVAFEIFVFLIFTMP